MNQTSHMGTSSTPEGGQNDVGKKGHNGENGRRTHVMKLENLAQGEQERDAHPAPAGQQGWC